MTPIIIHNILKLVIRKIILNLILSFKIAIIINILMLIISPISGDPSIIRGQAWPHPVQREQAHQAASGPIEEISYFIFRTLTFGECLMWAWLSRKYPPCGNDPKSEKKPHIAVTRKPYRSLTFRNGHFIARSSIFLLV